MFVGPGRDEDLSTVCNAILALADVNRKENHVAMRAFVCSCVPNGSFNDPDSFMWSVSDK